MSALPRERLIAALASALLLGALVFALILGLAPPRWREAHPCALVAFGADPPQPDRPPPSAVPHSDRPLPRPGGGTPAPADRLVPLPAAPAPIAVAIPIVTLPIPAGPGGAGLATGGAGGSGTGSGHGSGEGNGTGAGPAVPARQTHGHLSPRDVPDGLIPPGGEVAVSVRFTVGTDGRAGACTVIESSGNPAIDAVPCPLLQARYRFRPARDGAGKAVPETISETHTWMEPDRSRP